jgi:hypothetical protein
MIPLRSAQSLYESVDKDKVLGHEEWIAIARIVPKITELREQERIWHDQFRTECFIIADHIDFLMYKTFDNHERRVA